MHIEHPFVTCSHLLNGSCVQLLFVEMKYRKILMVEIIPMTL